MGVPSAEVLGVALGGLGLFFLVLCAGTDCWREDAKDPHSSVGLSSRCRGLWSECVLDKVAGLRTCDVPTSYLSQHPAVLVTTRALVIVTGVLCVGAMPSLAVGMGCTRLRRSNVHQKYKFTLAAGTLFLLGGLSGAAAALWYAVDTVQKYRLEVSFGIPGVTYELGYSYWMAVAGVLCTCAAGILLLVANRPGTPASRREPPRVPLPPDFRTRGTYL